jgi:hypothetical protein
MCLRVNQLYIEPVIQKGYKLLKKVTTGYLTPHQDKLITDCFIFRKESLDYAIYSDSCITGSIHGEGVHFYQTAKACEDDAYKNIINNKHITKCLGIGTFAKGTNRDYACKVLYLPELDLSTWKSTTVKILLSDEVCFLSKLTYLKAFYKDFKYE